MGGGGVGGGAVCRSLGGAGARAVSLEQLPGPRLPPRPGPARRQLFPGEAQARTRHSSWHNLTQVGREEPGTPSPAYRWHLHPTYPGSN